MLGHLRWSDVLFLHWRAQAEDLEARLPEGLVLDRFRGHPMVSLVALRCAGPAPRPLVMPSLDPITAYDQVNVRTYVRGPAGPGILLLDARVGSVLAAVAGRMAAQPYHRARGLEVRARDGEIHLRAPGVELDGHFDPSAPAAAPRPRSATAFCLERYVAYGRSLLGPYALHVDHPAWRVRPVDLEGPAAPDLAVLADVSGPLELVAAGVGESVVVSITALQAIAGPAPRHAAPVTP